ncbi:MAG TPA: hypothetical protein VMB23_09450, partial [Spirochaetia bacterium]|nr:hypothetical protein [Spirochaetia bacterium]
MKSSRVLFLLVLFSAAAGLSAQMVVSPLSSPVLASGGGGTASQESPFADRLNPAASAGKQRVTLDTAYFGLVGQGTYGNAFNLGLTAPQRWGVVTGGLSYWGSEAPGLNLGHQGRLTVGLSKDLWEDLYVGANVDTAFGSGGWGIGTGVGFLHFLGDWGWAKDFRWGGSLLDVGTAYSYQGVASPPIFTPAIGAEFSPWKEDKLTVTVRPDLSLPSFQDLNFNLGSTVQFGDFLNLNFALRF